ncbi:MAG: peroxidase, partial [Chloroflexi bacterium]
EQDDRSADLSARQRAMLDYADTLTRDPGALRAADMQALRAAGLDDRSILDLNQTVSYFAYVNRIADGLGVTVDGYALS